MASPWSPAALAAHDQDMAVAGAAVDRMVSALREGTPMVGEHQALANVIHVAIDEYGRNGHPFALAGLLAAALVKLARREAGHAPEKDIALFAIHVA